MFRANWRDGHDRGAQRMRKILHSRLDSITEVCIRRVFAKRMATMVRRVPDKLPEKSRTDAVHPARQISLVLRGSRFLAAQR